MFFIRRARQDDIGTLLKLAKMVHFINLPADREIISQKITNSRGSFLRAAGNDKAARREKVRATGGGLSQATANTDVFMFVLDDTDAPGCLGSSQLVAKMGGPDDPNVCFKLEIREKYSESLKVGTKNVVATLHRDTTGPTELGGLILQPSFRGHPLKLGKLLSSVRFHFVGLHRKRFRDTMLAEMMAPITSDGHNLLWEYLGRRFIPLSYTEADRFCQYSREFMTALLPAGDIHLSLLPPEARALVGEVGPETVPARKMLEKLGFAYHHYVDPFDGGPYLTAMTDDVPLVQATRSGVLGEPVPKSRAGQFGIVSTLDKDGEFFAVETAYGVDGRGRVCVPGEAMDVLHAAPGDDAGWTPTRASTGKPASAGAAGKRAAKKAGKKQPQNAKPRQTSRRGASRRAKP